jgi:hypothetical protein
MPYDIAGNQVLASPVSAFMQGRALRLADEDRRQRTALALAQEQRAAEEHSVGMEQAKLQLGAAKAKQVYAGMQQVLGAPEGKRKQFIEENFPDLAKQMQQNGHDWGSFDEDTVTRMAEGLKAHAAAELGVGPEKKFQTIETDDGGILQRDPSTGELKKVMEGNKPPSSYDEFALAQKDPAFAKFLKERKAKGGLSLTMPDGTTLELGDVQKVGPDELSKPTINNLQETIVNAQGRLDRLNLTLKTYSPDFLRAKGLVSATTTRVKDFLGMDVPAEQRKFLGEYAEFQANAANDFNQTLKELSGAAVTEHEMARAQKAAPSGTDTSPIEFEAKARATTKFVTRAIMRSNWALKNGIGAKSVEQLAKLMPIEGIDQVYEQRANEIWQEMGGKPETKKEAIRKANEEFGLAR